jgi:hypothetical protein
VKRFLLTILICLSLLRNHVNQLFRQSKELAKDITK